MEPPRLHASCLQVAPDHSLKAHPTAGNAASFEALQRDVSGMKRQVDMLCRALLATSAPSSPVTAHLLATSPDGVLRKTPVSAFDLHSGTPLIVAAPSPHPQGQWVADDISAAGENGVIAAGAVAESSPSSDSIGSNRAFYDDGETSIDGGLDLSSIEQQAPARDGVVRQQQQPHPPQQPRHRVAAGSRGSAMTPVDISFTPEPASLM